MQLGTKSYDIIKIVDIINAVLDVQFYGHLEITIDCCFSGYITYDLMEIFDQTDAKLLQSI